MRDVRRLQTASGHLIDIRPATVQEVYGGSPHPDRAIWSVPYKGWVLVDLPAGVPVAQAWDAISAFVEGQAATEGE